MTSDIRAQIEGLQADAEEATRRTAAAEGKLAAAQAREEDARSALQGEFKVTTVDEARAVEEKLAAALQAEVGRVRALLAQAGGEA